MNKLQITIFTLFLLQTSCSRNNDLKEVSQQLCECFKNYSEEDLNTMNTSIQLIDSLEVDISSVPKDVLISQLKKDCPKTALIVEKLAD